MMLTTRRRLLIGAFVLVATGSAFASGAPPPKLPAPATNSYARGDRAKDDAACMGCHGGIAREHESSLHRAAWSDRAFQKGYAIEKGDAFCRSCHAAEAPPSAEPDAWAASHGVTCVTCHRPASSGPVLAAEGAQQSTARAAAPHAITRVADFGTRACVRCHEFSFPNAESLGARGLMQKTVSEHAMSNARDRSCASCHMSKTDASSSGRGGHAFAIVRADLPKAVAVRIEQPDDDTRIFVMTATNAVGHAFPTGDLFRRIVLRVHFGSGGGSSRTMEWPFGRSFRSQRDEAGHGIRFESNDTRLAPEQRVAIHMPRVKAGTARVLRWELVYQRVLSVEQQPPFGASIDEETRLAEGTL